MTTAIGEEKKNTASDTLLQVRNLRTHFRTPEGVAKAVDGVSFNIPKGKTFALVGESGCGKSVTALSIMQLIRGPSGQIESGEINLAGIELLELSEYEKRTIRGKSISMIFQEPMTSLNPVMRIGKQIDEVLMLHQGISQTEAKEAGIAMLKRVRMPSPEQRYLSYPHELSGGMLQRAMIAMALVCKPKLLIADEPTTALDVTVQDQILLLMQELQQELGMSILLITHDLGVVAETADQVGVMYAGKIVETADKHELLTNPKHPYTISLLKSIPSREKQGKMLAVIPGQVPPATAYAHGCRFAPRCSCEMQCCKTQEPEFALVAPDHQAACLLYDPSFKNSEKTVKAANYLAETATPLPAAPSPDSVPLLEINNLKIHFPIRRGILQRPVGSVKAVDGVSLKIYQGRTLALVGESGCGKTTLGKGIVRLVPAKRGQVNYLGKNILSLKPREMAKYRSDLQMIFQDPYSSLNPRMMVEQIIAEGMHGQGLVKSRAEAKLKVAAALEQVGLPEEAANRYPHEFSGGQRQRIGIARALAVKPEFIICDEVTSALDVSVQAQILNLLSQLQSKLNLSYLFITHDLSVVRHIADEVAVMYLGQIMEEAGCEAIFAQPLHPYTQILLNAIPNPDPRRRRKHQLLTGDIPRADNPPPGCRFHTRCPQAMAQCKAGEIPCFEPEAGRKVRCLLYEDCPKTDLPI